MSYILKAILAKAQTLSPAPAWVFGSRVVFLAQGIGMIPVMDALYAGLVGEKDGGAGGGVFALFEYVAPPLVAPLVALSEQGVVGYVEAEYFGGIGEQRALAWHRGEIVLATRKQGGAINDVLGLLGVDPSGHFDAFDAVDLGRYRSTEAWSESAG